MASTHQIERALGDFARARLPARWAEPVMFVAKHLWAGLYGGVLMVSIAAVNLLWPEGGTLARYDVLLLIAVLTQAAFILSGLETRAEIVAVAVFCVLGLGLEIFNTARGHWVYPQEGRFAIAHVPLFVGFMYAAVGVCILRMLRIFQMRFDPFPPMPWVIALSALIYVNFFTQHIWVDIRAGLFAATLILFWRTRIWFQATARRRWWLPMLFSLFMSALGVWGAENLGTLTGTWLYEGQEQGEMVSLATLGSWYLFLCVALCVALIVMPSATGPGATGPSATGPSATDKGARA